MKDIPVRATEARELRKAIQNVPNIEWFIERLDDAYPPPIKYPWRKVVSRDRWTEKLECGHERTMRCGNGISGFVEPDANKRRCKKCEPIAAKAVS